MRNYIFGGLILIWLVSTAGSCNNNTEIFSTTPEINIVSVNPTSVKAYSQPILVTIGYKDGDGDLGFFDPDEYSIMVKDSRLSVEDEYHLHPLAPTDATVPIQGEIELELHKTFLLGTGGSETITYQIRLRDRAGHWSNVVTTPSITITP